MGFDYFLHESSYIDENVLIGKNTKIWHFSHIQDNVIIGENCIIGQNVYIGSNVVIGNGCKIQNNVSIYSGVVLEDYVFCGPSSVFTNDLTPRSKYPKPPGSFIKTLVCEGASIGANATIVCGNIIGKSSLIGAGGLITKNVPDYALMLGSPANQKGWVCECGIKLDNNLKCNNCNLEYRNLASGVLARL